MSAKNRPVADRVWPAVERAIRGRPQVPAAEGLQAEHMNEQFKAAIIRQVALDLTMAGVRVPEEC